ncbi:PA14 domain-containing protein [Planoprotostelium fungivorum]|uniref:PA14 domain-containing protein n=1 Tax=Planoprotostelium fungivorum TaxID=1890364 RepID=A0A2P6N7W6_9EUKA|nr:PA14 domain-containing protein [Planoprotostelium fungivorum]
MSKRLSDLSFTSSMQDGWSYPFDMFYCERQSTTSDLKLETNMNIYCPGDQYDGCGVCQGRCECKPPPMVDACTRAVLIPSNCTYRLDASVSTANCANKSDLCYTYTCDPRGTLNNSDQYCLPESAECTDVSAGWVVTAKTCPGRYGNATCYPGYCDTSKGGCQVSTDNICEGACAKFPCNTVPCSTVRCINAKTTTPGTVYVPSDRTCVVSLQPALTSNVPKNTSCIGWYCDLYSNAPAFIYNYPVAQNNVDSCDPITGECIHTPQNNSCLVTSCDPTFGITQTNITCKGVNCRQDPTMVGCCHCKDDFRTVNITTNATQVAGSIVPVSSASITSTVVSAILLSIMIAW